MSKTTYPLRLPRSVKVGAAETAAQFLDRVADAPTEELDRLS